MLMSRVVSGTEQKNSISPFQSQSQYNLFSLGMFTYTYERQDIIQIALKRLPGGSLSSMDVVKGD
jgi:hypothetical protein